MKKIKSNVLVVSAHPDDEVLGCGGAIARCVDMGRSVYVLILGEGISSRYKNRKYVKNEEFNSLKKQTGQAAGILGVKKVFFSNFPDNSFDSVPILKIIKEIERVKKIVTPTTIFTHHYGDLNVDHCIVYKALLTACRPLKGESVKEIYSFEVPSSTGWSGPDKEKRFIPDRFVDISKTIEKKIEAMAYYKNELRKYPHPRSLKGMKLLAQKRGVEVGIKYAEAFETIRVVVK